MTVTPDPTTPDFDAFASMLGDRIGLDLTGAAPTSVLTDVGFDSLAMAEVLVVFSDGDVVLPDELLTELRTLGDLFHYLTQARPAPITVVAP